MLGGVQSCTSWSLYPGNPFAPVCRYTAVVTAPPLVVTNFLMQEEAGRKCAVCMPQVTALVTHVPHKGCAHSDGCAHIAVVIFSRWVDLYQFFF